MDPNKEAKFAESWTDIGRKRRKQFGIQEPSSSETLRYMQRHEEFQRRYENKRQKEREKRLREHNIWLEQEREKRCKKREQWQKQKEQERAELKNRKQKERDDRRKQKEQWKRVKKELREKEKQRKYERRYPFVRKCRKLLPIRQAIDFLPFSKHKMAFILHCIDGQTLKAIGLKLGLSRERVRQLIDRTQRRLFHRVLRPDKFTSLAYEINSLLPIIIQ